jgi:lambda family phage minor tail protein L
MTINETVQEFEPGARIELFDIDATSFGEGILRFTASGFDDDGGGGLQNIFFDGNEYEALPIEADGFEWNGKGTQPTPTLTLSSIKKVIRSLLYATDGLVGALVTRKITFDRYLDGHEDEDGSQVICNDIFKVERQERLNKVFSKLQLNTILDIEGAQFPSGQLIRNTCINTYRHYVDGAFVYSTGRACPYVGAASFDINNNSTTDDNDVCNHALTGCRVRHGEYGVLPIMDFPGLLRV